MAKDQEDIADTDDSDIAGTSVTAKERLQILRKILYVGGGFYLVMLAALAILKFFKVETTSTELTTLITFLGSALTTILGVIIGSSLNNR